MSRRETGRPGGRRSRLRPRIETLEGRSLLTGVNFASAIGVGVTGNSATIHSNAIATDAAGDTYITGSFRGTAAFNQGSSSATFTTLGTVDTFVAKYGPTGSLLWAKTFAGQSTTGNGGNTIYAVSQGSAIAVDGSGNVFVAGGFNGTVNLTGASGVTQISSVTSATEPFVAKLNPSGNLTWVDVVPGTAYDTDQATSLSLDGSGGVVIAGSFSDSATFGATTLTASGSSEAFAARVNSNGLFLWSVATKGSGGSNADINGVALDPSGNIDLAGFLSGTVDFDPSPSVSNLTSAGSDDAVLWKLDANGRFLWARSYGSTDYDTATSITVDGSGNLIASGAFSGTVNFGTSLRPDSITAGPIFDAFVLKVDSNGNEVWVKGLVGPGGSSKGQGVAVDAIGDVHVTGTFSGLVDFDPGPGLDNLTSVGSSDVFLVGLDPSGNFLYARQAGQTNFNGALGVTINASGLVSITGSYSSSIVFGPTTLPAIGLGSIFVAELNAPIPSAPSAPVLEASSDTGASQTDGITSITSPVLDVNSADPSDTVELLRNGVVVAHRIGPGAISDAGPVAAGTDLYTAIQVSTAGITGPVSPATSVTFLTVPPPALAAPILLPADDSGALGDGITNVVRPRLSLAAKGGTTVQILNAAGLVIGSSSQVSDGTALVAPSQPLADGTYLIRARAVDLAGNLSVPGPSMTLTILSTPPAAPPAPMLLAADDSGALGDGLTNVRQPRLSGKGVANGSVQLLGPSNLIMGTSATGSDGSYVIQLSSTLADGAYAIRAVSIDVAGNISQPSATFTLTIDATPPGAPSAPILFSQDDSGTIGDLITNVRQPRFLGTSAPGLTIRLVNGSNTVLGTATATSGGSITVMPTNPLTDGTYTLSLVAVDAAGNVSATGSSTTLTIDGTPPATPALPGLLPADDTGLLNDGMTSVHRPRLIGTAEPGGRIDWIAANGSVLTSTTASASNGSYQLQPPSALTNGVYPVKIRETDVAGNVSPTSLAFLLTIRSVAGDDFGDSRSDLSNFRTSDAVFFVQKPTTGALFSMQFGGPGDVPINGDFFGNGHNDIAVYRPSTQTFYLSDPVTGAFLSRQFGQSGDIPVPGDFDGDGKTDIAVFRPSTSTFYILMSATNTIYSRQFGGSGDIPVPADYFGNGHADLSVYRPSASTFFVYDPITFATNVVTIGSAGGIPVPADYEGLGHADYAVYQPSGSTFNILMSATNTITSRQFGGTGDIPVPADYFGNGRSDLAVFRPSTATYYALDIPTSMGKVAVWGTPNTMPPTLAPITSWFSFGGTSSVSSIRPKFQVLPITSGSTSLPNDLDIPLISVDLVSPPVLPTPIRKPVAVSTLSSDGRRSLP